MCFWNHFVVGNGNVFHFSKCEGLILHKYNSFYGLQHDFYDCDRRHILLFLVSKRSQKGMLDTYIQSNKNENQTT